MEVHHRIKVIEFVSCIGTHWWWTCVVDVIFAIRLLLKQSSCWRLLLILATEWHSLLMCHCFWLLGDLVLLRFHLIFIHTIHESLLDFPEFHLSFPCRFLVIWTIVRKWWRKGANLVLWKGSLLQKALRRQLRLWFILVWLLNLIVLWIIKNHHVCLSLSVDIWNWSFHLSLLLAAIWWFVKKIVYRLWNGHILLLGLSWRFLRSRDGLFPWSTYSRSFQFFGIFDNL